MTICQSSSDVYVMTITASCHSSLTNQRKNSVTGLSNILSHESYNSADESHVNLSHNQHKQITFFPALKYVGHSRPPGSTRE